MLKFEVVPKINGVTARKTPWIVPCPSCQQEREVTYSQAWNIRKGKTIQECFSCRLELGLQKINISGLSLGRKFHARKNKYKGNKTTFYRDLFDHPSKKDDVKEKMRQAKLGKRGSETNHWIDGRSATNQYERRHDKYVAWRKSVFQRDHYTCQECQSVGKNLNAHHIKFWSTHPELRYDIDNGVTLCKSCHDQEHRKLRGN